MHLGGNGLYVPLLLSPDYVDSFEGFLQNPKSEKNVEICPLSPKDG